MLAAGLWVCAASVAAETPTDAPQSDNPPQQPAATPAGGGVVSTELDGLIIRQLRITGLDVIDEAYVRNQIRTSEGSAFSSEQLQRDMSRLLRTGRFLDIRPEPVRVADQVDLTIHLIEKPQVAGLLFEGNEEFSDRDLRDVLMFSEGDPLDIFEVHSGQEAIQRLYREKGYAYAEVTYDEQRLRDDNVVAYRIVENQRVRVRRISFVGNIAYTDRELSGQIETRTYMLIFRTGDFDPDRAERDAARLQTYYRERGYLDAEVGYEVEFLDVARERLEVIFRISEGELYTIREIIFVGNELYEETELLDVMHLRAGDPLVQARLLSDIRAIETAYGSRGYIYARVVPNWVFAEEPSQVVLTITITEGEPFEIGWIEVRGNMRTREKVVRRELRFYPEQVYDITKTRAAEQRLKDLPLFTEATIEPIEPDPPAPNVRDVLVNVEENPRTSHFIAGAGASSDSGLVGNIVLENTNFDIGKWPRTWEELFRGQAFRGAGQTFRIQLEPGTQFNRFRVDFREPYLMDRRVGLGTSFYLFERGRDGYDEGRIGGQVSLDRSFEDGPLADWVGEIALRTEYVNVSNRTSFAARDIRDVDGGNYLSSIKLSLMHDTTDSRFNPTTGHRFHVSYEQFGAMGGSFYHGQFTSGYARHWTVAVDDQDRHSVVSARVRGGQIIGDAPVFERFYAGGIGSMRGFDFRGISPRDGLRNNRVGGDFMLLGGAEYSFPLYAKMLRGVFFADMGTVERQFGISTWRAAVGGGIRLTLDMFGTIPMEFDLAMPLSTHSDDRTRFFSFFIGVPFL